MWKQCVARPDLLPLTFPFYCVDNTGVQYHTVTENVLDLRHAIHHSNCSTSLYYGPRDLSEHILKVLLGEDGSNR
jgi:hypothetical protein